MLALHAIGGLPRSGSTLLCNILAQNPAFKVTDTDVFPAVLRAMVGVWSSSPEVKHKLGRDDIAVAQQLNATMLSAVEGWYGAGAAEKTVFSKSRGWQTANMDILREVPGAPKLICVVRNPLNVFASMERHHRKVAGILDDEGGNTLRARADSLFAYNAKVKGLIGRNLVAIQDLLDRQVGGVLYLKGENLAADPGKALAQIYAFLGIEEFEGHQFENVVNVSDEPDYFYLNRYPHHGCGQVMPMDDLAWKSEFSEDFAKKILANEHVAAFCKTFGYNQPVAPKVVEGGKKTKKPKWLKT